MDDEFGLNKPVTAIDQLVADQAIQDGMLQYFLGILPAQDSTVERQVESEQFDFRDHISTPLPRM
jgi:hypothetical protein